MKRREAVLSRREEGGLTCWMMKHFGCKITFRIPPLGSGGPGSHSLEASLSLSPETRQPPPSVSLFSLPKTTPTLQ